MKKIEVRNGYFNASPHAMPFQVSFPAAAATSRYNRTMYLIAIGWLYVTLLMAITESSLTAGVMTFLLYGAAPLALFLWLVGTPQRRRNQLRPEVTDDAVDQNDTGDPRADQ
jgi:hypothetical protein